MKASTLDMGQSTIESLSKIETDGKLEKALLGQTTEVQSTNERQTTKIMV